MKYFFYSDIHCHIKINGEYFGKVTNNLTHTTLLEDNLFLEFYAVNNGYLPIFTTLSDKNCVKVFSVSDSTVIVPVFTKIKNNSFSVLFQKTAQTMQGEVTVSAIQDGGYKLYVDGYFYDVNELTYKPTDLEIYSIADNLLIIVKGTKHAVFCYRKNLLTIREYVDEYEYSTQLTTAVYYANVCKTKVIKTYSENGFDLVFTSYENTVNTAPQHLFLLSAVQLLYLNAPLEKYFCADLILKKEQLKTFIGSPVLALPSFENLSDVLIITNENAFILTAEIKDGLITNVIEK